MASRAKAHSATRREAACGARCSQSNIRSRSPKPAASEFPKTCFANSSFAGQDRRPDPGETAMNQHPQRQPGPAAVPMVSTPLEARKLAEHLMEVMSALLSIIERETELVRAGKIREGMAFEPKKTGIDPPLRQRGRVSESQPAISDPGGAGAPDHATSKSRRLSCHAADQLTVSQRRMRFPKASSAASTPRFSAVIYPTPTRRPDGARRRDRGTSRRCRSAARSERFSRRARPKHFPIHSSDCRFCGLVARDARMRAR